MDYEEDVKIDVAHFDLEWLRQADLVLQYGEEYTAARLKLDRAKEAMDVEQARAQFRIREKYAGMKPPTVDQIHAETLLDEEYTAAREKYITDTHKMNLIRAAYDAVITKKSTMENYLKGQLAGLWGEPIEPERGEQRYRRQAQENQREQANENARKASMTMKRTRSN